MDPQTKMPRILLTGATGYVGGRLLNALHAKGYRVTCLVRRPKEFKMRVPEGVEVVGGDVLSPVSLAPALKDIDQAFYLVHSMGSTTSYAQRDRVAARNFATEAARAGVKRILYLGGLGGNDEKLSRHLESRHEVGEILRSTHVPVIEFRASIIIGSGSLSFEMIRSLVERLPIMVTPKWVATKAQPIAIADVIQYLVSALSLEKRESIVYEIGGAEVVSYGDMMREYANLKHLHRLLIPVPLLTPRLSSLWLALITPLYARVGRQLIDSLKCETTVQSTAALQDFQINPMGLRAAIEQAIANEDKEFSESHWADAFSSAVDRKKWGGVRFGTRLVDARTAEVPCAPEQAFYPIQKIGGNTGWYFATWLWRLRGWIDLLLGGVGLKRGRRDPVSLRVGDTIDWWRVEAFDPSHLLRLRAEMKLPGKAWLEFEVKATSTGSQIKQTAVFDPHGLWGLVYWYGIYPVHQLVFMGMLKKIATAHLQKNPRRDS